MDELGIERRRRRGERERETRRRGTPTFCPPLLRLSPLWRGALGWWRPTTIIPKHSGLELHTVQYGVYILYIVHYTLYAITILSKIESKWYSVCTILNSSYCIQGTLQGTTTAISAVPSAPPSTQCRRISPTTTTTTTTTADGVKCRILMTFVIRIYQSIFVIRSSILQGIICRKN